MCNHQINKKSSEGRQYPNVCRKQQKKRRRPKHVQFSSKSAHYVVNLLDSKGPSQKFAEACETNNVSFIFNPLLPPPPWNEQKSQYELQRSTEERECWLWFSRAWPKRNCALKNCWQTSDLWKMGNHKPCRRRKEESGRRNLRIDQACHSTELQSICRRPRRSVACIV